MNVGGNELVVASDHELARLAAVGPGRALMTLRREMGVNGPERLRGESHRTAHPLPMPPSRRRALTARSDSVRTESGSSIHSTAPASTARKGAPIGPSTSP